MKPNDRISEILQKYGEHPATATWKVQGTTVVYHDALERIAAKAGIWWEAPQIIRSERDEAVILVTGNMAPDGKASPWAQVRQEWSIGEALVNVNYRVSGKQAAYVYAIAEKRAKDRVILKLIELHGLVYSEEEADEFKSGRPAATSNETPDHDPKTGEIKQPAQAGPSDGLVDEIKRKIDKARTINAVTDLMLQPETQKALSDLPPGLRDEVRDYAKTRLVALGWPSKSAA